MTDPPDWSRSWQHTPSGLIDLDTAGVIVAANDMFAQFTGHDSAQIAGRLRWQDLLSTGSRIFYQTQLEPMLILSGALTEVMVDVTASDGTTRPALMNARAVRDDEGRVIGVRIALTTAAERRQFESAVLDARDQAEEARAASARTQRRLVLQASATSALASSTDPRTALQRLAGVLVPGLADWCIIFTTDAADPGVAVPGGAMHSDPGMQTSVERVAELMPKHSTQATFFARSMAGSPTTLVADIGEEHLDEATTDPELRALYGQLDIRSAIVAPSYARGERVAVTILIRGSNRPAFTQDDRDDIAEVAARTGIVIDNTRRYAREHADSITLQSSLLTVPPQIENFEIAVRYIPAHDEVQVGGDWYDAYQQVDGTTVVVIGDVVGHNIEAAAAMGQLRGIIRTIGYTIAGTPSDTLARADHSAQGLGTAVVASAVLARIERRTGAGFTVRWSNAGHPPPMLIHADGSVEVLERRADVLLGVAPELPRHDHAVDMAPGSTLLLYTDGLVEHAREPIDIGLERLAAALTHRHKISLNDLCDDLLATLQISRLDDIALLAIRPN